MNPDSVNISGLFEPGVAGESGLVMGVDGPRWTGVPGTSHGVRPDAVRTGLSDLRVRVLDTSNPASMKILSAIHDLAMHGLVVVGFEHTQWVPEEKKWLIFIKWARVCKDVGLSLAAQNTASAEKSLKILQEES